MQFNHPWTGLELPNIGFQRACEQSFFWAKLPEAGALLCFTHTVLHRMIFAFGDLQHPTPLSEMSRLELWRTALNPIMEHDLYHQVQSLAFRYAVG